jgi:hypothetical protein
MITSETKPKQLAQESVKRKEALLQRGSTAPLGHELGRDILPRLVALDKKDRDAIVLYVYLLAHVNGDPSSSRYMSAWPSNVKIAEETGIDKNRIKTLADVLEREGLIKTEYVYTHNKREKLYYPMYHAEKEADDMTEKKISREELDSWL